VCIHGSLTCSARGVEMVPEGYRRTIRLFPFQHGIQAFNLVHFFFLITLSSAFTAIDRAWIQTVFFQSFGCFTTIEVMGAD
jgi:hypothetical protein